MPNLALGGYKCGHTQYPKIGAAAAPPSGIGGHGGPLETMASFGLVTMPNFIAVSHTV